MPKARHNLTHSDKPEVVAPKAVRQAMSREELRTLLFQLLDELGTQPLGPDEFRVRCARIKPDCSQDMYKHYWRRFCDVQASERAQAGTGVDAVVPARRTDDELKRVFERVRAEYGDKPCTFKQFAAVAVEAVPERAALNNRYAFQRYQQWSTKHWAVDWRAKSDRTLLSSRLGNDAKALAQAMSDATGLARNEIFEVLLSSFASSFLRAQADPVEMIVAWATHGVEDVVRATRILDKMSFVDDPRLVALERTALVRRERMKRSAAALAQMASAPQRAV